MWPKINDKAKEADEWLEGLSYGVYEPKQGIAPQNTLIELTPQQAVEYNIQYETLKLDVLKLFLKNTEDTGVVFCTDNVEEVQTKPQQDTNKNIFVVVAKQDYICSLASER